MRTTAINLSSSTSDTSPQVVATHFSVVIPLYYERDNIQELYRRLIPVMEGLCAQEGYPNGSFEIMMVEDGSRDDSWQLISALHQQDARVKGVHFSRNFGHHMAITAGIDHAQGRVVILMDGDLQDPPEEIPALYHRCKEGYDIVYGIRHVRHAPIFKTVTSTLFWRLLGKLSGREMREGQMLLRVLDRKVVDALKGMKESARFIHGMMAWVGFKTASVRVHSDPRRKGRSHYTMAKRVRLAWHALTAFSTAPLQLAWYLGWAMMGISGAIGLACFYRYVASHAQVTAHVLVILAVGFVGGIQLISLGIMGEYISRIYQEAQRRPLYIIDERLS